MNGKLISLSSARPPVIGGAYTVKSTATLHVQSHDLPRQRDKPSPFRLISSHRPNSLARSTSSATLNTAFGPIFCKSGADKTMFVAACCNLSHRQSRHHVIHDDHVLKSVIYFWSCISVRPGRQSRSRKSSVRWK